MKALHIQRFQAPGEELNYINDWMRAREMPEVDAQSLPAIGYIVYDDAVPVAVAFLRLCEGNLAILDGLTSNPDVPGPIRHIAIDVIIKKLIEKAYDLGIDTLIAWSVDDSTLKRSETHGFEKSPYALITKDLSNKAKLCQ